MHLKFLEKQEQAPTKISRMKEIIVLEFPARARRRHKSDTNKLSPYLQTT
jgi:hypothetical protein